MFDVYLGRFESQIIVNVIDIAIGSSGDTKAELPQASMLARSVWC